MGVNIGISNRKLNWIENYAYIDDSLLDQILDIAKQSDQFKLLKYLDPCDHAYFNSKQWPQLKFEIDILAKSSKFPDDIILALYECLNEVKHLDNQYFSFIGD